MLFFTQLPIPNYPLPRVTFSLKVPLLLARLRMEYVFFFIQIGPLSTLSWRVLQRELRQLPAHSESALGLVHLSIIMYD